MSDDPRWGDDTRDVRDDERGNSEHEHTVSIGRGPGSNSARDDHCDGDPPNRDDDSLARERDRNSRERDDGLDPRDVLSRGSSVRRRGLAELSPTTTCSSGLEGHVQELGGCLSMFETLGNDSECQSLHSRDGLVTVYAVGHHAGQRRHFCQPSSVIFALEFDRENHPRTLPSGPARSQADGVIERFLLWSRDVVTSDSRGPRRGPRTGREGGQSPRTTSAPAIRRHLTP